MKRVILKPSVFFVFYFIPLFLLYLAAGCNSGLEIQNPYSQVDWQSYKQYKANLHTHTTRSDGSMSPQAVIDNYAQLGYNILAITDHNELTFPWTNFSSMGASPTSKNKLEAGELGIESITYENRDPLQLRVVAVEGSEISSPQHLGCYFTDYYQKAEKEDSVLDQITARNGLVIFNHPGKYSHPSSWYCGYLKKYKAIIGAEVFNQGDRYPNCRMIWDSILVSLMPERQVWGFSNDDLHGIRSIGRSWDIFLLPELSEKWVRRAMEDGCFFFAYSPDGQKNTAVPQIQSIKVDSRKARITIESTGQDSIRWISGGKIIFRGNAANLKKSTESLNYIRAEIYGPGGIILGTQPFGIKRL